MPEKCSANCGRKRSAGGAPRQRRYGRYPGGPRSTHAAKHLGQRAAWPIHALDVVLPSSHPICTIQIALMISACCLHTHFEARTRFLGSTYGVSLDGGTPWLVPPHCLVPARGTTRSDGHRLQTQFSSLCLLPSPIFFFLIKIVFKISYWRGKSTSVSARKMKNVRGRAQSQLPKKTASPAPHRAAANSF